MTEVVKYLVAEFLSFNTTVNFWTTLFDPDHYGLDIDHDFPRNQQLGDPRGPVYLAACLDLRRLVQQMIKSGARFNSRGGIFGHALRLASLKGHTSIVSALLAKSVDVNARGGTFGKLLQASCYAGHLQIIQLLIAAGEAINAKGCSTSALPP